MALHVSAYRRSSGWNLKSQGAILKILNYAMEIAVVV